MLGDSKYYYKVTYKNMFLKKNQNIVIGFDFHIGWGEESKIETALYGLFDTNAKYISHERVKDQYGAPL